MLTVPRGRDLGAKGTICVSQIMPTCLHPSLAIVQLPTWLSSKHTQWDSPQAAGTAVPVRSTQGPGTHSAVSVVGGRSLSRSAPHSRALQLCRPV